MEQSGYPKNVQQLRPSLGETKSPRPSALSEFDEHIDSIVGALALLSAYSRANGLAEIADEIDITALRVSYIAQVNLSNSEKNPSIGTNSSKNSSVDKASVVSISSYARLDGRETSDR